MKPLESTKSLAIAGRAIGRGHPPYVVAEMSGNHNGDLGRAKELIHAAKESGADAVKLQTYTADTITLDSDRREFRIEGGLWHGETLYQLYERAHTPWAWQEELFAYARRLGITIFSSPFDDTAVDFLQRLDAPAYKIASFELIDPNLIARAAATGRPLIMSTGMADLGEIADAVEAARGAGATDLILLHCVSGYPTPAGEANLRTIPNLADTFGLPVGLSDHTLGVAVSVAAVSLGAVFIEKHFTLRRADGGPDAAFSLEPHELKDLVDGCRDAWSAMGRVNYDRTESERGNAQFRRSLFVVRDVAAGEMFTAANVRSIRPGYGLPPKHLNAVLGRRARRAIERGTPLDWAMVGQIESQ